MGGATTTSSIVFSIACAQLARRICFKSTSLKRHTKWLQKSFAIMPYEFLAEQFRAFAKSTDRSPNFSIIVSRGRVLSRAIATSLVCAVDADRIYIIHSSLVHNAAYSVPVRQVA